MLTYHRYVAFGSWLHIYPEGGVWQNNVLGGRMNGTEQVKGKLKWGIGKLIAHAPVAPVVIPYFHLGMEKVLPQDPVTKDVQTRFLIPGHRVKVIFGDELHFDDLIVEHERKYGSLWKYKSNVDEEELHDDKSRGAFHHYWDSREFDLLLYSRITKRIEDALDKLNTEIIQS
jgi:monolysocardiolipin acyltransferase